MESLMIMLLLVVGEEKRDMYLSLFLGYKNIITFNLYLGVTVKIICTELPGPVKCYPVEPGTPIGNFLRDVDFPIPVMEGSVICLVTTDSRSKIVDMSTPIPANTTGIYHVDPYMARTCHYPKDSRVDMSTFLR